MTKYLYHYSQRSKEKKTIFHKNLSYFEITFINTSYIPKINLSTGIKSNTCIQITEHNRNSFPLEKKLTFVPLPHVAFIVPIPRLLQHALGVDVVIFPVLGCGLVFLQTLSSVVIGRLGGDTVSECVSGTLIG